MFTTIIFLILSNIFMTFAWYGHLKFFTNKSLWFVIISSWAIAFLEYCFQVPANRIGFNYFTLPQLKVIQEVITMLIFAIFTIFFMKIELSRNFIYASICLSGAVFFIFKDIKL